MKILINKILTLTVVVPIIVLFLYSIFVNYPYEDVYPSLVSFKNYAIALNKENVGIIIFSIIIALISSFLALVVSYLFVRALNMSRFHFVKAFKMMSTIPILVPAFSYIMGMGMILNLFHLNDTVLGVIISHIIVILPYDIFLLDNSMSLIGGEFEELASTLGANEYDIIFGVSLPMMRQSVLNSLAIGFVISFSQYFLTLIIGGGVVKTFAMVVFPLVIGNNRALAATTALVFCLINIIVYMIFVREDKDASKLL